MEIVSFVVRVTIKCISRMLGDFVSAYVAKTIILLCIH